MSINPINLIVLVKTFQERVNHYDMKKIMTMFTSSNTLENMRYKFDKVVDELLLDFVHTKLDLYKKLSDPKVNPVFKSKWFEGYLGQFDQASPAS
jgi:type I restriction enzyme R subunit